MHGTIKINCVGGIIGEDVVATILLNFQQQNPKVNIQLDFSSNRINLLESDYDIVIRMGNLPDSNLIASTLQTVSTRYVASSNFLQKYGGITSPKELESVPLIYGSVKQWSLVSKKDKYTLNIHNNGIHVTSGRVMHQAAVLGLGVTRLVDIYVEVDIKNGKLTEVLPEYAETTQLSIVSLPAKYQLKRFSSIIKYIKLHFSQKYTELLLSDAGYHSR